MHRGGPILPTPDPAATDPLGRPPAFPPTGVGPGPRAENEARLGRRIGPYRLERLLGHGGMGAVYLATRADGEFEREVALKLIRMGGEDELSVRRFERERRILSRLVHPAIARLYDGGVDPQTGAPWFAMERIEGESLGAWCTRHRLDPRERVRLVVEIGRAVQYAHQQLVIHRDLKPSNILVDRSGAPHVLDFGIAALLDESEAERTSPRTQIHTPEYAAPEQIEGAPIGAATDVYALGVVLFELLTGARPFQREDASAFALQKAVLEDPTPSLASRLPSDPARREELAAQRGLGPAQWRRVLRSDLDAILRHALEKRPQDRYPSVAAFVEDLERWLGGLPVQAARPGLLYRGSKFVRRHRVGLSLVAAVFVLLAVATGLSLQQARKARTEAERAEAVKQFLVSLFQQARPGQSDDAVSAQQLLDEGRARLEHEMRDQPRLSGELLSTIGNAYTYLGDYAHAAEQLERALVKLPPEGDTLRPRLDALVDLVDLYSHQKKVEPGERYAAEARAILARLRRAEAAPWGWLDADTRAPRNYFGDAVQTLDSREEDLDLARARLLDQRGRHAEAITLRRRVADARDARPDEHPTRIRTAQNDLALALTDAGRHAEAIERFRRLLSDNERLNGAEHASSITVRHNLALALRRVDRLREAEDFARHNAALATRVLPPGHPMQAYVRSTLANILRSQGRHAEAADGYAQARAVFDGQPDADRDMLATIDFNDALNRLARHDVDGARAALERAHATWLGMFGPSYPRRVELAQQRVALALLAGDADGAQAGLLALDVLPPPAPGSADALRRAQFEAQLLRLLQDPAAALAALAPHHAAAAQAWPAPHGEAIAWRRLRAELALDAGDTAAAAARLQEADAQQAQRGLDPAPDLLLLGARLACVRKDHRTCRAQAGRAERAYAAYLADDAWPRRLARAWAGCAETADPAFTAAERAAHGVDVAAWQSACRP